MHQLWAKFANSKSPLKTIQLREERDALDVSRSFCYQFNRVSGREAALKLFCESPAYPVVTFYEQITCEKPWNTIRAQQLQFGSLAIDDYQRSFAGIKRPIE